jgi:hypothetical protein
VRSVYTWFPDHTNPNYELVFSNGDKTGAMVHSDFVSGWAEDTLPSFLANCVTNEGAGCSAGTTNPKNVRPVPSDLDFTKPPPVEQTEGFTEILPPKCVPTCLDAS